MDPIELGHRLRVAREARGMSQQASADAIGAPRTAITQMENGNRSVSTLELAKLAALYQRSITYFFGDHAADEEEDVLVVLHRVEPELEQEPGVREQVSRCVSLCREGVALVNLLHLEPRSGPPIYEMRVP